jgi:hypothetical protein
MIWTKMINLSESLNIVFEGHCGLPKNKDIDWNESHINYFFESDKVDMGHISIIDMRETRGMWMMHVNAYAKPKYPMPIYGFDVVCGHKKITGCFHDMSPTVVTDQNKKVSEHFQKMTSRFNPKKERVLPEWAKNIFSNDMIAAGNVVQENEISTLAYFGLSNLNKWFEVLTYVKPCDDMEIIAAHMEAKSKYCYNQLQNPNSKNVMVSLGLGKEYVEEFKKVQFPY